MNKTRAGLCTLALFLLLHVPVLAADAGPQTLQDAGLVELVALDPSVVLDIRYATTDNFVGKIVYPTAKCFLRKEVAERLVQVQRDVQSQGYGLKVFDCYRPFSVQKIFFQIVPDPNFVAQPKEVDGKPVEGSKHNRGAAVDLTLVDKAGKELPMPTPFDDFTEKARPDYQGSDPAARKNMLTLQDAMKKQGFAPIGSEWWHFDSQGWEKYGLLDVSLPQ